MNAWVALFKDNLLLALRDRSVIFFNYVFPLIFFFAFAEVFRGGIGGGISYFVSTVLTMGILGNGLWGAGMRSVQDREANILRRFKVTPISPLPMLAASMLSGWLLYLPVLVLLLGLARFIYGMPVPERWLSLAVMASLGVLAFRAIGLMLAAVANTMQEAMIAVQLLYMPMLFLSGATFPSAMLPRWAQEVAHYLPASYLVTAFQGILFRNETILENRASVGAMLLTIAVGMFLSCQLFRWEKGERIGGRARLSVLAVLGPFLVMGIWQSFSSGQVERNRALWRDLQRSGVFLIRNARIFTGEGRVIESGAVLVKGGKIAQVWEGAAPEPRALNAEAVEGAGKTLLPGLIDAHVHFGSPDALSTSAEDREPERVILRALSAMLYCGVTGARSAGDDLEQSVDWRARVASGRRLGAEVFASGPMFAGADAHGTQSWGDDRRVSHPKSPEAARQQVRELKGRRVDGISVSLTGEDEPLVRAAGEAAVELGLPLSVHTESAVDVASALELGAASVEHGAWKDSLPDSLIARMARKHVVLVPTLTAAEACERWTTGDGSAMERSLVAQILPAQFLEGTRKALAEAADPGRAAACRAASGVARGNLLRAWRGGVKLAAGTDSGNPLVFHGAAMHREVQLWVAAGIPPAAALEAATANAARLVGAAGRIGAISPGRDANLMLVDGNPLQDISATERISLVVFKGERVKRSDLFEQR